MDAITGAFLVIILQGSLWMMRWLVKYHWSFDSNYNHRLHGWCKMVQ